MKSGEGRVIGLRMRASCIAFFTFSLWKSLYGLYIHFAGATITYLQGLWTLTRKWIHAYSISSSSCGLLKKLYYKCKSHQQARRKNINKCDFADLSFKTQQLDLTFDSKNQFLDPKLVRFGCLNVKIGRDMTKLWHFLHFSYFFSFSALIQRFWRALFN